MKAFQLLELFLKTLMLPSDTLYAQYNSKGHFVPQNGHRSMVYMAAGELAEIPPVEILSKAHNALFSCAHFHDARRWASLRRSSSSSGGDSEGGDGGDGGNNK